MALLQSRLVISDYNLMAECLYSMQTLGVQLSMVARKDV